MTQSVSKIDRVSLTRRAALQHAACGFGGLALAGLCAENHGRADEPAQPVTNNPLAVKQPHFPARAKRIIFLFMQGGPSQVDTFDYKPALEKNDGKSMTFDDARIIANSGMRGTAQRVMKSPWKFKQYGESARHASDLFPETARHMDDFTLVHSMHTEGVAHGPATLFLHCGSTNFVRPSFGSWVTYGLGTENENLPGFVALSPSAGNGGPRNLRECIPPGGVPRHRDWQGRRADQGRDDSQSDERRPQHRTATASTRIPAKPQPRTVAVHRGRL